MKIILIFCGFLSLTLGVIGVFLPILPTTPFLLLASFLFLKSSDKLHKWLINHKYLGTYIKQFQQYKAITLTTKIISVSMLWLTILFSIFFVVKVIWLKLLLLGIAIGVSIHILSYKTFKKR